MRKFNIEETPSWEMSKLTSLTSKLTSRLTSRLTKLMSLLTRLTKRVDKQVDEVDGVPFELNLFISERYKYSGVVNLKI